MSTWIRRKTVPETSIDDTSLPATTKRVVVLVISIANILFSRFVQKVSETESLPKRRVTAVAANGRQTNETALTKLGATR